MTDLPAAFLGPPIAHRGLHDRDAGVIENSMSAVRAAVAAGYGVEIDLQLSADGEAMVFHDDELARLTGREGRVDATTAEALAATPLTGAQEGPPRFAEVLAEIGDAALLVEIKRQATEAATRALTARAAALLDGHAGPAALMSFDPVAVFEAQARAPDVPRGLVSLDYIAAGAASHLWPEARQALSDMKSFEAAGCAFASYHWRDLPTLRTQALRDAGVPILCWTTRSAQDDAAARRHADNVTFEGYRPPV